LPHDLMTECERRTLYVRHGERVREWKRVKVTELDPTVSSRDIRCAHCHGRVRLHKQQVENGPQDHVEHYSRDDSEGCPGGIYYQGTSRTSANPVV